MKERPIIVSGQLIPQVLAGIKRLTRRIAKDVKHPDFGNVYTPAALAKEPQAIIQRACPYGQPGDRLWVRETHLIVGGPDSKNPRVVYRASNDGPDAWLSPVWRPSIHMPRWASRITLEITGVRLERLQAITREDAIAEGVQWNKCPTEQTPESFAAQQLARQIGMAAHYEARIDYVGGFRWLWESLHGAGSWVANPWVWVVEFKRLEATHG